MRLSKAGLVGGGDVKGSEGKKKWWSDRAALDKRLGALLERMDREWLSASPAASLLCPPSSSAAARGGAEGDVRGHVVLVLDDVLSVLPWEATPSLRPHSVSRVPSVALLRALLPPSRGDKASTGTHTIDASSAYFVLNPGGDLPHTQAMFHATFEHQQWEGVAGAPPDQAELVQQLETKALFAYCGHGAGERYVKADQVLMGCSSARLKREGTLEPRGMDVSDRDIDRFADSLLRRAVFLPDTPHPPAGPSDTAAPAPVECVALARDDVRMKHLIGAAPVCYGVPVTCLRRT
ncbi:peptidase family C50-domain-containing protein [Baffinella frigidus]|nr:peptidase family C50-domain-containing protein [Cryptophyta sp. CCMP2293]